MDGAAVLGTATLSDGAAMFMASNLGLGAHAIAAVYAGDAFDTGGTSAAIPVTVTKGGASVMLVSSQNPSLTMQSVSFTAAIKPATATGSVSSWMALRCSGPHN